MKIFCINENFKIKLLIAGPLLGRVPWVHGTRKILSPYVMAPVKFYDISREQLRGKKT